VSTPDFILSSDIEEITTSVKDIADDFAGKTILLAGGRGFLGRYFTAVFDALNRVQLAKPCRLIVLDNLITAGETGSVIPTIPNGRFVKHDICTPLELDEPVDFVVHAAGIASPFYYRAYPLETLDVSVLGNRCLLDLAVKNRARHTFFSSSEIYGDPDPKHIPTPESYRGHVASQGPRACYDESKRVGETLSYIFHTKFGVATNIIRPFNVYGPGMQETDYRVLPNFASRIKSGRALLVYGRGSQTRTFCYVSDAINGFLRVIARGVPGETYNIGNPKPEISMEDLVLRLQHAVGRPLDHNVIEYPDSYPADEPNRRCPDIRKAQIQLGFHPAVDLDVGLARFLGWTQRVYTGEQ
jgi:UDP-glucuronate decarboxylase